MIFCGGGLFFFRFCFFLFGFCFWGVSSSDSLDELYPKALRLGWVETRVSRGVRFLGGIASIHVQTNVMWWICYYYYDDS